MKMCDNHIEGKTAAGEQLSHNNKKHQICKTMTPLVASHLSSETA